MLVALRKAAFAAAISVISFATPFDVSAAQLRSVKVTESASLPAIRPNWKVPKEPNQLFYLQRSSNSNTVIYTALFDASGKLETKRPAQAYWRRYNTDGARKGLKRVEQRFAYGLNISKSKVEGEFIVSVKALPKFKMRLRQSAQGKAELIANLGNRQVRAVYGFVSLDESGLIPKVTAVSIHGIEIATGRYVTEVFSVSGGAITQ